MRTVGIVSHHHPVLQADRVVASLEELPEGTFEELLGHSNGG
jgi:hypothetical protein